MRKFLLPVTAFAVVALIFALQSRAEVKPGNDAPAFSLQDQDGKTVSLADFKGKTVVLEWFNNDCPYVQRHYKANTMNETADKYKDKDVVWLAINSGEGNKPVRLGKLQACRYSSSIRTARSPTKAASTMIPRVKKQTASITSTRL